MRRKIIAGNWKMNGTIATTQTLITGLIEGTTKNEQVSIIVCPPFTSLYMAGNLLKGSHIALGAQNMSEHKSGAYTGEVSAEMLLTVGARYVILGHSERRQYFAEADQLINSKVKTALSSGLIPIICIGETLEQRESGQTEAIVGQQLEKAIAGLSAEMIVKAVLAYEPVWAIGTGKTATPEMAQAVHRFIRRLLEKTDRKVAAEVPILYGGSVKPDNARGLLSQEDIDGALVGGASLKATDFIGIINAV